MSRSRKMPSKQQIFAFWEEGQGAESFEKFGIEITDDGCFACGFHFKIERCHIVAVTDGGTDNCDNLHLLCPNCHIESEYLNESFYWKWLVHKNQNDFKTSNVRQYERMHSLGIKEVEISEMVNQGKYEEAARYSMQHLQEISVEELEERVAQLRALREFNQNKFD